MKKLSVVLSLLSLSIAGGAFAQEDRTGSPYFFVKDSRAAEAFPLEETRAKAWIAGVIAHVRVTQVYQNEGAEPIEAVYVFPGSTRAAVFGMEMTIGGRTIVAEIAKSADARRKYEQAKEEGKAASLLEQERANVFRMNVANIMPGDRIEVRLDYTELLVPEHGVYELVYPTVVGPRFTGESKKEEGWTANPHLESARAAPYRWGFSARIAGGMAIQAVQSPSHRVSSRFDAGGAADVEALDEDGGNRDFILRYRLDGDRIETGMLLHRGEHENFFTAIVQPPKTVALSMIPPREYLFIIDVSGSMGGFPIATAKALMQSLLDRLRSEDRFNVLLFSGGSEVLGAASVPADAKNIRRARTMIDRMQRGGGTEILQALRRALAMPRTPEMSATMVVITDGYVSVEEEALTLVHDNLASANLFAFGIGTSVNRLLIEGLARQGMGRPFVVERPELASAAAERFQQYVESPVLTNIQVEFEGFDAYDIEPQSVPDLFGERPLIIMGKYRGSEKGAIRISGMNGQGRYEKALELQEFHPSDDLISLRHLWARDRIARLSDFAVVGVTHEQEITALGLEHHLMTQFTSFVAVDSLVRNTDGKRVTVRQPLPMPEGVSNTALEGLFGKRTGGTFGMGGLGKGGLGTRGTGAGGGGQSLGIGGLGSANVMGSLDKGAISKVIKRSFGRVKHCYEKPLAKDPSLAGKVVVRFVIGADGKVVSAQISSTTLASREVEECLLRTMKLLVFPAPSGGGTVTVSYPFNFSPT